MAAEARPRVENLYALLGVEATASRKDIRGAYRKLARVHHPDVGGNPDDFQLLKLAHECLIDDGSRQLYDETGEIRVRAPDNSHQPALVLVQTVIDEIGEEYFKAGQDVMLIDMVNLSIKRLMQRRQEMVIEIEKVRVGIAGVYKFARAFKAKTLEHANVLTPMFEHRARELEHKVELESEKFKTIEEALHILDGHLFVKAHKNGAA